jgi:hypothetical protein
MPLGQESDYWFICIMSIVYDKYLWRNDYITIIKIYYNYNYDWELSVLIKN